MTDDQDKLPSDAEDADLKPKTNDPKRKDRADEATSKPEDKTAEEGPSEQPS